MVTKREQKDGRVITLPVYVSNHITDEMIRLFLESGKQCLLMQDEYQNK